MLVYFVTSHPQYIAMQQHDLEAIFQSKIDRDIKIEPKDWMPQEALDDGENAHRDKR